MSTFYVSPSGAGDRSGSSIANAASVTNLNGMIVKAGPGGTVGMIADQGSYLTTKSIMITASGADGAPVTIKGVDSRGNDMDAVIVGTRAATYTPGMIGGNELFRIEKGASDLTFENMSIKNVGSAFRVAGDVKNLTVQDVEADNVQRFFDNLAGSGNKTATIDGLTLRDVDIAGFSKGAIRLQYDTHNVLVENVIGDSEGQDGDEFAIGVHISGTAHDIVLRKVTMANATDTVGDAYWNGDAFATENKVYNVTFDRTVARGSTDGGYDLKSTGTVLIGTIAEDNARNYRIWGEAKLIDVIGLNPNLRGGSSSQVQVWTEAGSTTRIIGGVFADTGSKTTVFDARGTVTVEGTKIVLGDDGVFKSNTTTGKVGGTFGDIIELESNGTNSRGMALDALLPAPTPAVPEVTAPAPTPTTPVAPTPPAPAWSVIHASTANTKIVGTDANDKFMISGVKGTGTITNFEAGDVMVLSTPLKDGNGDGLITFGKNKMLDIGNGGQIKIEGVTTLRLIAVTEEGHVYGDAAHWPAGATLPAVEPVRDHQPVVKPVPVPDLPTGILRQSTSASETIVGTSAKEVFDFSEGKNGSDKLSQVGGNDLLVFANALNDSNGDGIITFAKGGIINVPDGMGAIKVSGLSEGLRALGENAEGHFYADASVRPDGAKEGRIESDDTLAGSARVQDVFFFDTALGLDLGSDRVTNFDANDLLVFTSKLDLPGQRASAAASGSFDFLIDGHDFGQLAITDTGGAAVSALEYDGMKIVNGVEYHVYSALGSPAGLVDGLF